jgi:hypothetical protein
MAKLIECPADLALRRDGSHAGLISEHLADALAVFKGVVVHEFGGSSGGVIVVNSLYRPLSDVAPGGPGPRDDTTPHDYAVDETDANGHFKGRSVDYSARLTSWSFWGEKCPKWRRDDLRDAMHRSGIHHPWYWRGGIVGGAILEYWHAAVEFVKWKQKKAYRGPVPHWYDGLRGAER